MKTIGWGLFFWLMLGLCVPSIGALDHPPLLGIIRADTVNVLFGYSIYAVAGAEPGRSCLLVHNGRASTYLYRGGQPIDTVPYLKFDSTLGLGAAVADINGDGVAEVAMPGLSSFRYKMNLYYGGTLLDTVRDAWFGPDAWPPCRFPIRSEDLNANGTDELLAAACDSKTIYMFELGAQIDSVADYVLRPVDMTPGENGGFGHAQTLGDFNGDGRQDLAIAELATEVVNLKGRIQFYWGGAGFDSFPDFTIQRRGTYAFDYNYFGRVMTSPGDLNADGYPDIFVSGGSSDDTSWIYYCGPNIDTIPDVVIPFHVNHACPAGDINRDGYADLLTSYDFSFSGDGRVYVFYGGPDFDGVPDIQINNWDDSILNTHFGMAITGLGDFNGDGVDDFAFTARDSRERGLVYIYSGTGVPTAVEDENTPDELPATFRIADPYPNPFNATLSIPFTVAERQHVTIDVCNALGQKVATLVDREMPAGEQRVTWRAGNAASGVYFVRMRGEVQGGDAQMQVKRVVLVK